MPNTTQMPGAAAPSLANGTSLDGPPWTGLMAEIMNEWYWFYEEVNKGVFQQYEGEHIAIYGRAVVDHDANRVELCRRASEAHGVPPNRIIYPYIDDFGMKAEK